uniref:Phenylalanine-tRNA ligase beta subunit n=1 Tax=Aphanocladia delicatula TaxID=3041656 RepID=UPI002551E81C|nr:Phenylalanine-tRNA ligase beta subunit [Aphanocladia delicatula]WGH14095.1 Phenylalanine-tRNA ligase beta subunit [Aphanocladia delicatula]
MKFSWQLINNFTKLDNINFKEFKEKLALSGLEIDKIENEEQYKDKIIDLSITNNREEIFSSLSLAIEINTIFNTPIKTIPIPLNYKKSISYNNKISKNTAHTHIAYIRIVTIENILNKTTPKWLLNNLEIDQIDKYSTLNNIKEYINKKWGQTFYVINYKMTKEQQNMINDYELNQIFHSDQIELIINKIRKTKQFHNNQSKLLIFTTITKINNTNFFQNEPNEFYENMFIDSMKLITTIIGGTIQKYDHAHEKILIKNNTLKLKKENINKSLGYIEHKKLKFLNRKKINKILAQLKLHPKYDKIDKSFEITVPYYRKHDLKREIDIIEEIGRIYQFKYFFNKIKKYSLKGHKSKTYVKVQQIRNTLRQLGLHEVINCGITKNIYTSYINPKIYNPITNTQKELRTNILENLINTYEHNIKHSQNNIEIFEIGKIFNKDKKIYTERRHISGLIHNNQYTRNNWNNNNHEITLSHFKNIIEILLENINSDAILKENLSDHKTKNLNYAEYLFKRNKQINIYDQNGNNIIGILGELDKQFIKKSSDKNEKIYIFEIDLNKLIETTKLANHLKYVSKQYSQYPSVTRDISLKLEKYIKIQRVKQTILEGNNKLIESIEIFNEYFDSNKVRYVGMRITYRSQNRTLNHEDIRNIDINLENNIKQLQKS